MIQVDIVDDNGTVLYTEGKDDPVNHPSHYQNVPGIECKDVIGWFPGHVACAIKYLWRCGHKTGADPIQDLKKAHKFISFEIERLEKIQDRCVK